MESRVTNEESSTQLRLRVNRDVCWLQPGIVPQEPHYHTSVVGVVSFVVVVSILFIGEWTGGAEFDHDVAQE